MSIDEFSRLTIFAQIDVIKTIEKSSKPYWIGVLKTALETCDVSLLNYMPKTVFDIYLNLKPYFNHV
jgi:hypothetical protein